ncbi:hypothetical protein [Microbacterium sp. SORGH_AS_0888]|uniref:hypothetical protein n=1 Tax=Microbacterium sp. SORGH_AS_0888 TaxID=3041791 RepID=UPI002787EB7F|nr:hypothetical protein [Microbacterium sp. SORGH_AS_0888]MDQ1130945.1 hypothetical protein [Microbacterium sp. SORGH_AS_0888]
MKLDRRLIYLPLIVALAVVPNLAFHDYLTERYSGTSTQAEVAQVRHEAYEDAKAAGEVGFDWKHSDSSSSLENGVLTASWSGEVVNRDVPGKLILTLDGFDTANFTADELDDTEVRVRLVFAEGDVRVWRGSLRDFALDGDLINEMRGDSGTYVKGGETVAFNVRVTTAPTVQPYTPMTELPELSVVAHHVY